MPDQALLVEFIEWLWASKELCLARYGYGGNMNQSGDDVSEAAAEFLAARQKTPAQDDGF